MKKLWFLALLSMIVFSSCSTKSDEDLYNEAKQYIQEKKYEDAVRDFRKIVNEYPNGKFVVKAMFELAQLYHGKAVKGVPEKESLATAVEYYKKVFEKSPNSKEGEKALFMAAFLDANELQRYNEAKKLYEKFLEKFPQSELAPSAKEEIQNIGIPPEEILKRKVKNPNN